MKWILVGVGVAITVVATVLLITCIVTEAAVPSGGRHVLLDRQGSRRIAVTFDHAERHHRPPGVRLSIGYDWRSPQRGGYPWSETDDARSWLGGQVWTYRLREYNRGDSPADPSSQQRTVTVGYRLIQAAFLGVAVLPLLFAAVRRAFLYLFRLPARLLRLRAPRRVGFPVIETGAAAQEPKDAGGP